MTSTWSEPNASLNALCLTSQARDVAVTKEPWDAVLAVQGLVNATPVGMAKMPGSPIRADLLRPSLWVADVIYFPAETELLRAARRLGCRTMNGGSMAVFQAVQAFHAFTGRRADPDRMHRHFQELCDIGNGKLGRNAK